MELNKARAKQSQPTTGEPVTEASEQDQTSEPHGGLTSRRQALGLAAAGGVGAAAGLVAGGGVTLAAGASGDAQKTLSIEVALRVATIRPIDLAWFGDAVPFALDPGDLRGGTWYVEGWIYPIGTFKGDGFIPTEGDAIGTWFCRGNLISSPQRPDPHVATTQEYYFGTLDEEPIGQSLLISQGLEGRNEMPWAATRAVTGGTGEYRGARGTVVQTQIGVTSELDAFGMGGAYFRFDFDIDVL